MSTSVSTLNMLHLKYNIIIILLFLISSISSKKLHGPVVKVSEGKVRGLVQALFDGSHFYSFRGIPYAAPPVGNLRFKAPLPPKPWKGVRDAFEFATPCTQFNCANQEYLGDEDCLFINVYTKSLNKNATLPVMVLIYGGKFAAGSADFAGPEFLIQHDVILVTFNYRSDVPGFLSLEIPDAPGNAGMKDQVEALRWVQRNIAYFGGDPSNVTLFGGSSGATCVFFHWLSPMSKGLFHKLIAQSGSFDLIATKGTTAKAFRVGKLLGKDTDNVQELLTFFRGLDAHKLTNVTIATLANRDELYRGMQLKFIPVVEKKFPTVEAFIDEDPAILISEGKVNKVPFMLGYNSGEGIISINDHLPKLEVFKTDPSFYVPEEVYDKISKKQLLDFGERIKKFYFGDKDISKTELDPIKDLLGDSFYVYTTQRLAYLHSLSCKPTYMYRFQFVTELNIMKQFVNHTNLDGASHADEVYYLFNSYINQDLYNTQPRLRDIVYNVTKLWTNFAKASRPTLDNSFGATWLPYTASGKEYFEIGETFALKKYPDQERMEFWNELYKEAGLLHISD